MGETSDLNDPRVVGEVLSETGFDPEDFINRIGEHLVRTNSRPALKNPGKRGAFGAPTFFVDGEMFFGQDRLVFVAEALSA
ncbi:MAG: hypothetical protein Ct9H300mP16_02980 [Pseudomonadota bacterium]|nr:MAG: hypothetical protein Ct9H300mP16_02980 [Pseudomonadota bacterium]